MEKIWNDIRRLDDEASGVAKFLYTKNDAAVESVLYKYPDYKTRTVICFSTQSGCPVGCRFCGTGDYFIRSLTKEEIVDQVAYCLDQIDCDPNEIGRLQLMAMSMGEPLLNLKNFVPALDELYNRWPKAALLVSTAAPRINYDDVIHVSQRIPTIGLQFSVHESTDKARDALIPFKKKLTLREIAMEGERWHRATKRNPFFNYCAHDKNETDEDADRILKLFNPKIFMATVSVVCERADGFSRSNEHQRELAVSFGNRLLARGFDVRVFDPAGQDTVGGGCGQLFHYQNWIKDNPDKAKPSIGNGLPMIHSPQS